MTAAFSPSVVGREPECPQSGPVGLRRRRSSSLGRRPGEPGTVGLHQLGWGRARRRIRQLAYGGETTAGPEGTASHDGDGQRW